MRNLLPPWLQKLHWYQQLSIIAFFAILASWLLQLLTPKPTVKEQFARNFDQTVTKFSRTNFVGRELQVPEKLAVGTLAAGGDDLEELMRPLIERYQLLQLNPSVPVWAGPEYSLSKNVSEHFISLSRNQIPTEQNRLTDEAAISLAQNTLRSLYPQISVFVLPEQTEYFSAGPELAAATSDQAGIVRLLFMPTAGDLPIYSFFRYRPAIEVWVSSAGLEKLVVVPPLLSVTLGQEYASLSVPQALKQIESGVGSIIFAYPEDVVITPRLSEVDRATFSEVFLEYRINPETKAAIPSYRFVGTLTTRAGDSLDAEVITPAIAVK